MDPESSPYTKPLPHPSRASQPFWTATREHRLHIQRSKKTGRFLFYPRNVSPFGADDELEWVDVSGRGHVYTFTVARRPVAAAWVGEPPLIVAIVELDEGPHLTTNLVDCSPAEVRVGMPVEAVFDDVTAEVTLVKFRPLIEPLD